jgi:hypothetical protein
MKPLHVWVVAPTAVEAETAIIARGLTHLYSVSVATNREPDGLKGQSLNPQLLLKVNEKDWSVELMSRVDQGLAKSA